MPLEGAETVSSINHTELKQHNMNDQPVPQDRSFKTESIFIVGVSRSGTSLMRHILNQSDLIAIARESHFLGHLIDSEGTLWKLRQFGDLSDDENVRKLVDFVFSGGLEKSSKFRGMSSFWKWITKRVEREEFLRAVLASDRSERGLFIVLMRLFADRKGKPIMGEKTPAHIRYVSTLLDWFPRAKFIHMLRDPRGIFISELRRRYAESESFPYKQLKPIYPLFKLYILLQTSLAWLDSVNRYHKHKKLFTEQYYLMKFEDLVREPEANIRALCSFLGVDFQPEMLNQTVVSSGFQLGKTGFDAQAADRWKKLIRPWENAWFVFWFNKHLVEFGYMERSFPKY